MRNKESMLQNNTSIEGHPFITRFKTEMEIKKWNGLGVSAWY